MGMDVKHRRYQEQDFLGNGFLEEDEDTGLDGCFDDKKMDGVDV